jgi:hypothetical protein
LLVEDDIPDEKFSNGCVLLWYERCQDPFAEATVAGRLGRMTTNCFFGLFDTSLDGCTTSVKVDKRINLILADYLDVLSGSEFLQAKGQKLLTVV